MLGSISLARKKCYPSSEREPLLEQVAAEIRRVMVEGRCKYVR